MKGEQRAPDVVDFAYDIIALHEENLQLRHELEHYKKLHEMNTEALNKSHESTKESIGIVLNAVLDPNSAINKRQT